MRTVRSTRARRCGLSLRMCLLCLARKWRRDSRGCVPRGATGRTVNGDGAIYSRTNPAQFLRRPLAIWPTNEREGKVYGFIIARSDGQHLTINEYVLIRAALGMTTLSREEVRIVLGTEVEA
jgi:hypothetical protein